MLIKRINFSENATYQSWKENAEKSECLIITNDTKLVINTFDTKNTTRPDGFTREFLQILKKEVIPILRKFCKRIRGTIYWLFLLHRINGKEVKNHVGRCRNSIWQKLNSCELKKNQFLATSNIREPIANIIFSGEIFQAFPLKNQNN